MKKLFLLFAISLTTLSCSEDNNETTNDVSTLYFDLLASNFQKSNQYDNLPLDVKVDLWEFKYNRFLNENNLTLGQIVAVQDLKNYVATLEFDADLELSEGSLINVYENFDFEDGTFLLAHLGNSQEDYTNAIQKGCWWCWDITEVTNPCHVDYVNGEAIGFYQTVTVQRRGVFGIRGEVKENILLPCDDAGIDGLNY